MEFAVFFLSVFAVFVASTAAPMPCDTPEQWEGTATLQDQENGELYIISLSYDAKNNRTRSFTVLLNGQEHKMREVILLHEQNIFFFIMVNIKVCIVSLVIVKPGLNDLYPSLHGLGLLFQGDWRIILS
jgi:hypothetical protein